MKQQETRVSDLTFTVLERAVLYARVSGDDRKNEGRNLESQIEMGREYAKENNYAVVRELKEDDKGESGYEIDLPKLNEIREMAHAGQIDVLVVRELDRLSRNLAKQLIVEEELKRAGVRVEYVLVEYDDTPEGRLQKHLRATIAEYEREKIKERVIRGKRNKAKQGHVNVAGRPPMGYRVVELDNGNKTLEVNPTEASIVKYIFELFVNGLTIGGIRSRLSEAGIPTVNDLRRFDLNEMPRHWFRGYIHKVLTNSTYIGEWYFGKAKPRKYRKNTLSSEIEYGYQKITHPEQSWIKVEVPPIISRGVFEIAQQRLSGNAKRRGRATKHNWLLTKRAVCGECGYKLRTAAPRKKTDKVIHTYYQCPALINRDLPRSCSQLSFRQGLVETVVWGWLEEILSDRKRLEEELDNIEQQRNSHSTMLRNQLEAAEAKLKELEQELNDTLEVLKELKRDGRAYAVVLEDIDKLEDAINKVGDQHRRLSVQLEAKVLAPDAKGRLFNYADKVAAGLEVARTDFDLRRAIIEALDVTVRLIREDGQPVAYVTCYLYDVAKKLSITNQ